MSRRQRSMNVYRSSPRYPQALHRAVTQHVTSLESRLMMHAGHVHDEPLPPDVGVYPSVNADATVGGTTEISVAAASPLTSVPALSSRPTATAKLYLDFDGDTTTTWGQYAPGTTPAYDSDGDATTFSDTELASIREIWTRVAEKFSPFNIDVTTVNPATLANRVGAKVVFGGAGAWLGSQAGGVAYVGGFYNSASNVAFVFPKNLANGYATYAAEAAAHESGHLFGLQHQGTWSGNTLVNEYAPANAAGDAPIMGGSYTARRGLWWYGTPSTSPTATQDDLAVLSNTSNAFGYRADDFGNDLPSARALTLDGTSIANTAGVVERMTDADVFSFVSGAGAVNLFADVNSVGAMLDLKLTLRDASGAVLAAADSASLGESLSVNLTSSGTYYLTVASHGGYGDVGQYTVRGSVQPIVIAPPPPPVVVPTIPAAPSGLVARALSTSSIRLSWVDNSTPPNDETGFKIYSSRDNRTWSFLGTVGANVTSVDNTGLRRNATYYYRVLATNTAGDSAFSNTASARTTAVSASLALAGDLNLDGVVDFEDLVRLGQNYNQAAANGPSDGDVNGDGIVDFNDLALLSQNYNTASPALAADDTGSDTGTLNSTDDGTPVTTPAMAKNVFSKTPLAPLTPIAKVVKVTRPAIRRA